MAPSGEGEQDLTQDEFADKSGLHRTQVGAFENGRMNITLGRLHLVAQTLGVRIIDLFKALEDWARPSASSCGGKPKFR